MRCKHAHTLALERVPDVAVEIVVTGEEEAARDGEANRGNAAENVVVCIGVQFAVSTEIPEAAAGIVRAAGESVAVGEKPDKK